MSLESYKQASSVFSHYNVYSLVPFLSVAMSFSNLIKDALESAFFLL